MACPDNLRGGRVLSGIGPPRIFPPFPFPRFVNLFLSYATDWSRISRQGHRFVNASPSPALHVVVNAVQRQSSSSTSLHFFFLLLFFFYLSFSPVFSSLLVSLQLLREWKDRRRTPRSPITMSLGNAQIRKALASCRISCKDFRITAPPPDRIFEALEVKS